VEDYKKFLNFLVILNLACIILALFTGFHFVTVYLPFLFSAGSLFALTILLFKPKKYKPIILRLILVIITGTVYFYVLYIKLDGFTNL
jgi:hypothetical protein